MCGDNVQNDDSLRVEWCTNKGCVSTIMDLIDYLEVDFDQGWRGDG